MFRILALDEFDVGKVLVLVLNSHELNVEERMMLESTEKPWKISIVPPDPTDNLIYKCFEWLHDSVISLH